MHSRRLPGVLFIVLLLLASGFIVSTSGSLPPYTAAHFGASGQADGYMTRNGYRLFMLAFSVGLPLCVVLAISLLPRYFPRLTNIPYRTYWLAPVHWPQALAMLDTFGYWFGCGMVALLCGVHWLVLQANLQHPAQLAHGPFFALLGSFGCLVVIWVVLFYRCFRPPPG
ncbi:MAG: hypothetical protein AB7N91_10525 [Candidatus Tectimicrobiota bacterium]